MSNSISRSLPTEQMLKLQFLVGNSSGIETMYPPEAPAISFRATVSGSWEPCERFLKLDFYADIPGFGVETFNSMITYSPTKAAYCMWAFASSQEDPLPLAGNFENGSLVLVSEPSKMIWGWQRLRFSLTPLPSGQVSLVGDRWELDGYVPYCSVIFQPESVFLEP